MLVGMLLSLMAAEPAGTFAKTVLPIFKKHCFECHSEKAKAPKSGLLLDTPEGRQRGGDRGPAIVAGDPANSLLLQTIKHEDEELRMPPDGKLKPAEIKAIERWIKAGAKEDDP